jgi:hypothetical protein
MIINIVGAELFRADGQTDRHDEANSRFSKFCERVQRSTTPYPEFVWGGGGFMETMDNLRIAVVSTGIRTEDFITQIRFLLGWW